RHELVQIRDVMAQRRELDGAREELQQVGQVAAWRALAECDRDPEDLLPAGGQRRLQRSPQCVPPPRAEPVDVPDDQASLAVVQFRAGLRWPVVIAGVGGVEHVERAGRVAVPVHGLQQWWENYNRLSRPNGHHPNRSYQPGYLYSNHSKSLSVIGSIRQ